MAASVRIVDQNYLRVDTHTATNARLIDTQADIGIAVLADQGLADVGGLDIDAAAVGYLGATYAGRYPDQWQRLEQPETTADRRARRLLWDDVRRTCRGRRRV